MLCVLYHSYKAGERPFSFGKGDRQALEGEAQLSILQTPAPGPLPSKASHGRRIKPPGASFQKSHLSKVTV